MFRGVNTAEVWMRDKGFVSLSTAVDRVMSERGGSKNNLQPQTSTALAVKGEEDDIGRVAQK